jgi:wobble nucleotide-excising tRNase
MGIIMMDISKVLDSALADFKYSIETIDSIIESGSDDINEALEALESSMESSSKSLGKVKNYHGSKAEKSIKHILQRILFLKTNMKTSMSKTTQEKVGAVQAALFANMLLLDSIHEEIQDLNRTVKQLKEKSKKIQEIDFGQTSA